MTTTGEVMSTLMILTIVTIAIVLFFDYTNGFHDAANIVATIIASRAMTPAQAVIIVGTFEFLGPLLGGTAVANTIGKFVTLGDVQAVLSLAILMSGLVGAIVWNLATWYFGIPSSSSHALVGGLIGAVVVSAGIDHVVWGFSELMQGRLTGITKVLASLILSPLLGFWAGFIILRLFKFALTAATPSANKGLRYAQFVTSAGLAFSHGANDAQKMLSCAAAITLGILSGGWRIVRTLGFSIYRVRPVHALSSQLTSALIIMSASILGAPVSTTHVVATSIMGIGAAERPKSVRWKKAKDIGITWLITIPGSAVVAIITFALVNLFIGKA